MGGENPGSNRGRVRPRFRTYKNKTQEAVSEWST